MTNSQIHPSQLPGYEAAKGLIDAYGLGAFNYIWKLSQEIRVNETYDTYRVLILDMGQTSQSDDEPLIRITMNEPRLLCLPEGDQILGLSFHDMRMYCLEDIRFEVIDYEHSGFSVSCSSIVFSRIPKPTPTAS